MNSRAAGHQPHGFVVKRPEQLILEPVPELVAGGLGIHEGVQRQEREVLEGLDLLGKIPDHGRVIQVAALGNARHEQVMLDHQAQGMRGGAVQAEAPRHAHGQFAADFLVLAGVIGLADVVQQQRQVEHEGTLEMLEQGRVSAEGRLAGLPDAVQLLEANQRVLVGGVLVIKLVLHQAGEPAELGNVFAEQIHLVHRAQDRAPRCRAGSGW